jgi:uncharacterized membrane protein
MCARVLARAFPVLLAIFLLLALLPPTRAITPVFAMLATTFLTLCVLVFLLPSRRPEKVTPEVATKKRAKTPREDARIITSFMPHDAMVFLLLVALCGLLALAAPMLAYVDDPFFGGTQRRLNTVFRFGLQAWLLLGTAAACGIIAVISASETRWKKPMQIGVWYLFSALWIVPAACSLCVIWTRTTMYATKNADGSIPLSLDGARFLPESERRAVTWLQNNAAPGARVLEAPISGDDGTSIVGDYDARCARIASLSGVAAPLGWPQHAMFWGADWNNDIVPRWNAMKRIYGGEVENLDADLNLLGVDYIFIGSVERERFGATIPKLEARFRVAFRDGATEILRVPRS